MHGIYRYGGERQLQRKENRRKYRYLFESPNSRHTETKYDESKLMAPRVESVNDLAGQFCVEWGETFDSDIGQMSYTYDSLGRIKGKS